MWSYYGSKAGIVNAYPKPICDKIIEPFAGSARYALKYFDRDVLLVDKYDVLVKVWKWLQQCSEQDILSLPRRLSPGQTLNEFAFDCEEARFFMGFIIGFGSCTPRNIVTPKNGSRPNAINYSLTRIAKNLFKIRHWEIRHGCYSEIENQKATWFIDPPYQFGGHAYKENSLKIDFPRLSKWCLGREGQVIVCETTKADWMPFKPLVSQQVLSGSTAEAIWSNLPTAYDHSQMLLFQ